LPPLAEWRCGAVAVDRSNTSVVGFWCNLSDSLKKAKIQRNVERNNTIESMNYDSTCRTKIRNRDRIT
jgi:hypothetical protein